METQVNKRQKKNKETRSIYKVKFKEFLNLAGRIASGGISTGHPEAIHILKKCVYIQKGIERINITDVEAAQLLKQL